MIFLLLLLCRLGQSVTNSRKTEVIQSEFVSMVNSVITACCTFFLAVKLDLNLHFYVVKNN